MDGLSDENLTKIESAVSDIRDRYLKYGIETRKENSHNNGLYSCWNTFHYVSNNLNSWADDTLIGAEVKKALIDNTKDLKAVIDELKNILDKIEKFVEDQKNINKG